MGTGRRVRICTALIGLLVAGASSACSGSASKGPDPDCEHLKAVSRRLASAEQDLVTGRANERAALSRIVTELEGLRKGAPEDIDKALSELAGAFRQAEPALQHRNGRSREELARAATVLAADGRKVSSYVTSKCTTSN
jgi:hypothetical protein